jgi:hypothetical protein
MKATDTGFTDRKICVYIAGRIDLRLAYRDGQPLRTASYLQEESRSACRLTANLTSEMIPTFGRLPFIYPMLECNVAMVHLVGY